MESIDALVGDVDATGESVGMSTVESVVAVDAVGGLAEAVVERRDLRTKEETEKEKDDKRESGWFHETIFFCEKLKDMRVQKYKINAEKKPRKREMKRIVLILTISQGNQARNKHLHNIY